MLETPGGLSLHPAYVGTAPRMTSIGHGELRCWHDTTPRPTGLRVLRSKAPGAPALSGITDASGHSRYAGGRGGRNSFEAELVKLGVIQKNSCPNHPTTCGKVERVQQTILD